MKILKILIVVFGILGVVAMFIPEGGSTTFAQLRAMGMGYLVPVLGGFAIATVMGIMAIAKPPLLQWQAGVAAAGFLAVFIRLKFWELLKQVSDLPPVALLIIVAAIGGLVSSIVAAVQRQEA